MSDNVIGIVVAIAVIAVLASKFQGNDPDYEAVHESHILKPAVTHEARQKPRSMPVKPATPAPTQQNPWKQIDKRIDSMNARLDAAERMLD